MGPGKKSQGFLGGTLLLVLGTIGMVAAPCLFLLRTFQEIASRPDPGPEDLASGTRVAILSSLPGAAVALWGAVSLIRTLRSRRATRDRTTSPPP
jgi:hypothetical protein